MIKIHSTILGEGQPFLFLHGFLGMSDNWKTLGTRFSEEGYQVHLIDQRNHGRSEHTPEMSYELMATDVYEYCKERDLSNIILLGHSMGGKTAMQVAGDYPHLVKKLIIVDISPRYYSPHHQEILDGLTALDEQKFTSRGDAEDFLSQYIKDEGTRLFLLKNLYWKTKEQLSLRINLEVLKDKVEEIGAALPAGLRFDKETLFIKGGRSNYIQEEDEARISLHFSNSEIVEIKNAGHWVHAEKMKEFYEAVKEFL